MLNRLQATRYIVQHVTDEPIIASLGNPKFDLFTAQDRPQNFYMWKSMGMASSMGLGLAMVRPQQKVIVLDGDGALLQICGLRGRERRGMAGRIVIRVGVWFVVLVGLQRHDVSEATGCDGR